MQHGDHAELRDSVGQVQQEDGIGGLPQRSLLQRVVHALADQQADEGQHDQRRNLKFTARQSPQSEYNHTDKKNNGKYRKQNRELAAACM